MNVLRHGSALQLLGSDMLERSMAGELDKMRHTKIYEIVEKTDVISGHTILRSV